LGSRTFYGFYISLYLSNARRGRWRGTPPARVITEYKWWKTLPPGFLNFTDDNPQGLSLDFLGGEHRACSNYRKGGYKMAYKALAEIVERTVTDEGFRRLALERPSTILSGYDLDPDETAAVREWLKRAKEERPFPAPGIEEELRPAMFWI